MAESNRTDHWKVKNAQFIAEMTTAPQNHFLFLGNSITEGFDLERFFPENGPINRGISGDHTDGLLERLDTSVLQLHPTHLFILIGINDIGAGYSDSTIIANYTELLQRVKHSLPETRVFLHTIMPTAARWSNCPPEKVVRINNEIKRLAGEYHYSIIDLYPHFVTEDSYLREELSSDGLHLNEAGYQVWQKLLNETGLK